MAIDFSIVIDQFNVRLNPVSRFQAKRLVGCIAPMESRELECF